MAVRIRLKRMGKIHAPFYRVVIVDSRKKRDGRVIEEIGTYNPLPNPSEIHIESERALYWLGVGAQPSTAVRRLLVLSGDIARHNGKTDAVSRILVADKDRAAETEKAIQGAEAAAEKSKAAQAEEKARQAAEAEKEKAAAEAPAEETPAAEVEGE